MSKCFIHQLAGWIFIICNNQVYNVIKLSLDIHNIVWLDIHFIWLDIHYI